MTQTSPVQLTHVPSLTSVGSLDVRLTLGWAVIFIWALNSSYLPIDNITDEVLKLGRDISRDFCYALIHSGNLALLGLCWKDYILDYSLHFGFKHGSFIFQRLSYAYVSL